MSDTNLPAAGLYRTIFPHPKSPQQVPARSLVFFSPTSDQGPPIVLLPSERKGNLWAISQQGFLTDDEAWCKTMVPLPAQGYYTLTRDLVFGAGQTLPQGLLVLFSYTRGGDPVAFPGVTTPENAIAFARDGVGLTDLQLPYLQGANFRLAQGRTDAPA